MSGRSLCSLCENISINFCNCQIDFAGNATVQLNSPQRKQELFSLVFFDTDATLPCELEQAPCGIAFGIPADNRGIISPELERAGPQNFLKLTLPRRVQT